MTTQNQLKLDLIVALISSSFFSTVILTPNSYSYVAIFLGLVSLLLLHKTWKTLKYNRVVVVLFLALSSYFLLYLASMLFYGESARAIDLPSRSLLAATTMLLLLLYPPKLDWVFISIIIGSLSSGFIALYFYFKLDTRAFYGHGYFVIQSAGMCAWLGIFCLITFIYAIKKNKSFLFKSFASLGTFLAFLATLLSGTRGSWLLTPFIIIALAWSFREYISKKIVSGSIVVIVTLFFLSAPLLNSRIQEFNQDLNQYSEGESSSSSGARLEMWKSAFYTFQSSPVFGVGHMNLLETKQKQVEAGQVDRIALEYDRAHNQFFEELQTKGLIGLSVLIFFFLTPLSFFLSHLKYKTDKPDVYIVAWMGISHVFMIVGFSLTQHYLNHHSGIIIYSFGVAIFASLIITLNRKDIENTK